LKIEVITVEALNRRKAGRSLTCYKEDLYLCARCGYCKSMVRARDGTDLVCPIREKTGGFDASTAKGRNIIARGILEGRIDISKLTEEFIDSLYSCTLCGNCQEHCLALDPRSRSRFPNYKFTDRRVEILGIVEALRSLVVERGTPPSIIRKVLSNISLYGNPEGKPRSKRAEFAEQLNFRVKKAEEGCPTLLYVGSIASYNPRNNETVKAVVELLHCANVDFCVLSEKEEDSGADALRLGETGLFEELANRNFKLFSTYKIKHVICVSPHDYDAFINDYPIFLGEEWARLDLKIQHYTEFLAELLRDKKLSINKKSDEIVTFHDPCYLGRINGIYEAPRKILHQACSKVVEMRLSRNNSYCCGGGGGGIWYESMHKPRLDVERVNQALQVGAEVIAVACPLCAQMLESGVDAVGCNLQVLDVAEILLKTLNLK
jgi:Fe-S oxidoreductase